MKGVTTNAGRSELPQAFFILMEMSWLAGALGMIQAVAPSPDLAPLTLAALIYPAAYGASRLASLKIRGLRWALFFQSAALAVTLAVVLYFTVLQNLPSDDLWNWKAMARHLRYGGPGLQRLAVVSIAGGFIWWRGWSVGRVRIGLEAFSAGFQAGLVLLAVILFLVGLAERLDYDFRPVIIAFFFNGLAGLWLIRTESAGSRPGRYLHAPLLVVLILAAAYWFAVFVDRGLLEILLSPVFYLFDLLGRFLNWLASLFPDADMGKMPLPEPNKMPAAHTQEKWPFDFAWVKRLGEIAFFASFSFIILGALWRIMEDIIAWLRRRLLFTPGVVVESSGMNLWRDLRDLSRHLWSLFSRLLKRLRTGRKNGGPGGRKREVRRHYLKVLKKVHSAGWVLQTGRTPLEFRNELTLAFPGFETDIETVTSLYCQAKYELREPSAGELQSFHHACRRLRHRRAVKRKTSEKSQ